MQAYLSALQECQPWNPILKDYEQSTTLQVALALWGGKKNLCKERRLMLNMYLMLDVGCKL